MTKLTQEQKKELIDLIHSKKNQLGTYAAVAKFLEISEAAVNQLIQNKYNAKGDSMWLDIANKLEWQGLKTNAGGDVWKIVATRDYKLLKRLAIDAKNKSLFMPISDVAGMGKTACLKAISNELKDEQTFYIRCWDWGKKEFITQLCKTLGIDTGRGFKTPNELLFLVIEFFQARAMRKPLLIIDEADKLKSSALRFLIPLYNECEDTLACLIAGTENLEKEIKRGVKHQAKGYDEIDSRFGRKFIKLMGCTAGEAKQICEANGISKAETIEAIIKDCNPAKKLLTVDNRQQMIDVVTDLRRLKRLVQREQLLLTSKN